MSSGERPERERGRGRARGRRGRERPDLPWARPEQERRARRTPRSREEIVAAALVIADTDGLEAVSMRRVAGALGVGAMTLYTYVEHKDQLVTLMLDEIMDEIVLPELPDDWREALRQIALRTRAVFVNHPWLTEVPLRPRLGPKAMRHVDQSVQAVAGLGLDRETTAAILAAVDDYALGHAFREVSFESARMRIDATSEQWEKSLRPYLERLLATGDYPHLAEWVGEGMDFFREDTFERGLDWLLDGIAARIEKAAR